jgi:hypothetical protein
MCTQFNIFLALPPVSPRNYDILNMDRHKISISTTHRSARKTGSSELWRTFMSRLGVLPSAAINNYTVRRVFFRQRPRSIYNQIKSFGKNSIRISKCSVTQLPENTQNMKILRARQYFKFRVLANTACYAVNWNVPTTMFRKR